MKRIFATLIVLCAFNTLAWAQAQAPVIRPPWEQAPASVQVPAGEAAAAPVVQLSSYTEFLDLSTAIITMMVPRISFTVSQTMDEDDYWDNEYEDFDLDSDLPAHIYPFLKNVVITLEIGKRYAATELRHRNKVSGMLLYNGESWVLLSAKDMDSVTFTAEVLRGINQAAADNVYLELFKPSAKIGRRLKAEELKISVESHLVGPTDVFAEKGYFAYRADRSGKKTTHCLYQRQGNELVTDCLFKLNTKVEVLYLDFPLPVKNEDE